MSFAIPTLHEISAAIPTTPSICSIADSHVSKPHYTKAEELFMIEKSATHSYDAIACMLGREVSSVKQHYLRMVQKGQAPPKKRIMPIPKIEPVKRHRVLEAQKERGFSILRSEDWKIIEGHWTTGEYKCQIKT